MNYLLLPVFLLACASEPYDADLDLLPLEDELELGTDPDKSDSDGDGLSDGDEVHFHLTDPTLSDSDGDGDDDGWELSVGLDPLDAASHRYPNDWPHQPLTVKEELQRRRAPSVVEVGKRIREFVLPERQGMNIDLYDFALNGTPIVVMECSAGCAVIVTQWVEDPEFLNPIGAPSASVRDAILAGSLRLIISISEDYDDPPSDSIVELIERNGPVFAGLPILLDQGFALWGHLGRRGLGVADAGARSSGGSFVVLDENMVVRGINDWQVALDLMDP